MALTQCRKCGGTVSDKAKICPHCGEGMIEETVREEPALVVCEDCGNEIPAHAAVCPQCGCPAPNNEIPVPQKTIQTIKSAAVKNKSKIAVAIIVIVLVVGFVYVQNNVLFGDDKIAYELILKAADNFKDPSSVRLVSGTLGLDKDCLYCGISATNGWGARSTSYYFISEEGWILEEDDPSSLLEKKKGDLNVEKINRRLKKTLGGLY